MWSPEHALLSCIPLECLFSHSLKHWRESSEETVLDQIIFGNFIEKLLILIDFSFFTSRNLRKIILLILVLFITIFIRVLLLLLLEAISEGLL